MTTTQTYTRKQVLELARRTWPKCKLRYNPKGLTREQREDRDAVCKLIKDRIAAIDAEIATIPHDSDTIRKLLRACRFVVDIDGDDPSIGELAKLLPGLERYYALIAERVKLKTDRSQVCTDRYRWVVVNTDLGGIVTTYEVQADDLGALVDKINAIRARR